MTNIYFQIKKNQPHRMNLSNQSLKPVLVLISLFLGFVPLLSQDLEQIELNMSNTVVVWQKAATRLDHAVLELNQLRKQYDEIQLARDWMATNLEGRKARKESKKNIRRAAKAYRNSTQKIKKVKKEIQSKQKEVNKLSVRVEMQKEVLDKLSFRKRQLLEGGVSQGKKVYSGYFPKYKSFYHASAKDDLLRNPPAYDCVNAFDGADPRTNKHRIEQQEAPFFTIHPDRYPLIDGEPYLTCFSYFTLVEGGQYFLNLDFKIHTPKPRQAFGYLERGSRLIFTFLNGDELTLTNNVLNMGKYNEKKGVVVFRGQYATSVYAQNELKKNDIDKVRVEWARGYDDYEVFNLDLLRKQIKCLL